MKYSIKVTEAKNQEGNVKGFATLVFGDSFKITNIAILENLLQPLPLRPDVTVDEVVDTFRQFQDFINANDQAAVADPREFCLRDRRCKKALEILLYGVIDREDKSHVG